MAHFARIRASGFWTLGSAIAPAELEAFDANLFKAINGDDGGTWAPTLVITIGGSGLTVTGPASLPNVADITIDGGTLDLAGAAVFSMTGTSAINLATGTAINANSGASIDIENGGFLNVRSGGDLDVKSGGEIDIESGGAIVVTSGGAISVEGLAGIVLGASSSISASSGSKITGTLSQECRLTKTGAAARTPQRYHTATADAAAYFDCSYDTEFYQHTIPASVTHTLRITGGTQNPVDGDELWFHVENTGGGTITFVNEGLGASIVSLGGISEARLKFGFRSTMWRLLMAWNAGGTITPSTHA